MPCQLATLCIQQIRSRNRRSTRGTAPACLCRFKNRHISLSCKLGIESAMGISQELLFYAGIYRKTGAFQGRDNHFVRAMRSRNGHGHLTRAILRTNFHGLQEKSLFFCENLQEKCRAPRSRRRLSRELAQSKWTWTSDQSHFTQEFTGENAAAQAGGQSTNPDLIPVWAHCLGKKVIKPKLPSSSDPHPGTYPALYLAYSDILSDILSGTCSDALSDIPLIYSYALSDLFRQSIWLLRFYLTYVLTYFQTLYLTYSYSM